MAQPAASQLAPGFLVAAPALTDPNFAGSLVLMAEHHGEGALGFVVNRPGPLTVADVLGGGPVQPERLWILFRPGPDAPEEGAVRVSANVALGGSRELLEALVRARA